MAEPRDEHKAFLIEQLKSLHAQKADHERALLKIEGAAQMVNFQLQKIEEQAARSCGAVADGDRL